MQDARSLQEHFGSRQNIDQIAYLVGDFITVQKLAAIKPSGGFDVITCLRAFSNVTPDLRGAMLRTWTDFLAPQGPQCV
jgi:hypothetical protein